jgi:hypothetical protein
VDKLRDHKAFLELFLPANKDNLIWIGIDEPAKPKTENDKNKETRDANNQSLQRSKVRSTSTLFAIG